MSRHDDTVTVIGRMKLDPSCLHCRLLSEIGGYTVERGGANASFVLDNLAQVVAQILELCPDEQAEAYAARFYGSLALHRQSTATEVKQ